MKKFITLTTASAFFFGAQSLPVHASKQFEASSAEACTESFLRDAPMEAKCRPAGAAFDIHLFKPGGVSATSVAPVLYLLGGPGSLATPQRGRFAALARRTGRMILVPAVADGLPQLDCHSDNAAEAIWGIAPRPEDAAIYARDDHARKLDACMGQIRTTLEEDEADTLSTDRIASQLMDARQAFKLQAWHVFAESYGARIALALAGLDRAGTLSQTLDSPETPWVPAFWHTGDNFHEALKTLSSYCRDHFYCPAKRQHIERILPEVIFDQKVSTAAPIALKNINTGQIDAYARPTREQLLISSFHALRTPNRASILPYIVASPKNARERFGLLLDQLLYPSDGLNTGMHHLIRCRELAMEVWYQALEDDKLRRPEMAPLLNYLAWRQQYACSALGIAPPDRFDAPSLPHIPTLVLSGELDPVTPPRVIEAAFAGRNSYQIKRYRSLGHVTHAQKDCVLEDVMAFWRAPGRQQPRTSCSSDDLALRFYSPVVVR